MLLFKNKANLAHSGAPVFNDQLQAKLSLFSTLPKFIPKPASRPILEHILEVTNAFRASNFLEKF